MDIGLSDIYLADRMRLHVALAGRFPGCNFYSADNNFLFRNRSVRSKLQIKKEVRTGVQTSENNSQGEMFDLNFIGLA